MFLSEVDFVAVLARAKLPCEKPLVAFNMWGLRIYDWTQSIGDLDPSSLLLRRLALFLDTNLTLSTSIGRDYSFIKRLMEATRKSRFQAMRHFSPKTNAEIIKDEVGLFNTN